MALCPIRIPWTCWLNKEEEEKQVCNKALLRVHISEHIELVQWKTACIDFWNEVRLKTLDSHVAIIITNISKKRSTMPVQKQLHWGRITGATVATVYMTECVCVTDGCALARISVPLLCQWLWVSVWTERCKEKCYGLFPSLDRINVVRHSEESST